MVYTNGKYLLANTVKELHQVANRLEIPYCLFRTYPFPSYKLDHYFLNKVLQAGVKSIEPATFVLPLPTESPERSIKQAV